MHGLQHSGESLSIDSLPARAARASTFASRALVLVFFFGIFEGAARKWLIPDDFPELSYVAYLSKFLALWIVCALIPVTTPLAGSLREFRAYLQVGLVLLASGALLSSISGFNLAGGVLTFVLVFASPVLGYLTAARARIADTTHVLRWIAVLSVFPAVLGLIQYELPVHHVLNRYLGDSSWKDVITDLGRVRATGTFSFISGMTVMTVTGVWAGISLRILGSGAVDRLLGTVAILAGFACGFTALSRGAVFMGLALLAARLVLVGRDRQLLVLTIIAALGYGYLSIDRPTTQMQLQVSLASGVFVRHAHSDTVLDRVSSWGEQLSHATSRVPLGSGFGTNQIGAQAIETGRHVLKSYEGELARLVAEVGVLGLAGVLIIRIGLLLTLFHVWWRIPGSPERDVLLISMATLCLFFISNTAFNHVAAGFVWPIAAIALALASNGERWSRRG